MDSICVFLLMCGSALAQRVPANTTLTVRLDATVSSETAHVGDVVPVPLAADLVVAGRVLARRGSPLRARVTYARQGGRFRTPGYVMVRLDSITVDGRRYDLSSTAIRDEGKGHTESNVTKIGGGAGIGRGDCAIADRGTGALLGGLAGAGAGTGLAAVTGRQHAELPAESVYTFQLVSASKPH